MICPYCHSGAVANQSEPLHLKCCACLRQWQMPEPKPDFLTTLHGAIAQIRYRNLDIHAISMSISGWSKFEDEATGHAHRVTGRFHELGAEVRWDNAKQTMVEK